MKKNAENLPMPVDELEALATYYDTHDTSAEMEKGEWVDPRPMKTTSLRLPAEVVDELRSLARQRWVRYTAFVRQIIEAALSGSNPTSSQLAQINERLARLEEAVIGRLASTGDPGRAGTAESGRSVDKAS